ncbi:HNH endonuclease signature motif containing protein [Ferriphaselus sp. R-1]|uniref:HNH endonuclease n=1 Tax=Ferriphaselus sp. R-1 TaxID=1485544 RepID=UPI000551677F|nr:HNH endonuclease signature motif containing protein [Ferriphaselus sp. R-1]
MPIFVLFIALLVIFVLGFIAYKILLAILKATYEMALSKYFKGDRFQAIRKSIDQHTQNCNDLNEHIENLKCSYSDIRSFDYGESHLHDGSRYNMKRKEWIEERSHRTHNCSASVCKNASNQPFKYLCKYFNIEVNEETLSTFEEVLNNFAAAEQGKLLLKNERDAILFSISNSIPAVILRFSKERVIQELGFSNIDFSDLYFPVYTFQYVSAGGNSASQCDIKLNIENLDKFIIYMSNIIEFKNSIAGQRALMTSSLREKIKSRDNFTCKICSLSVTDERNLLLEIDHVIPLAKGGTTSEENLQTLCWKCNRSKGSKIPSTE